MSQRSGCNEFGALQTAVRKLPRFFRHEGRCGSVRRRPCKLAGIRKRYRAPLRKMRAVASVQVRMVIQRAFGANPVSQPTDAELQKCWDTALAKWKAGECEHPLAHHPHAVRCDGAEGCFTVAPIRDLSAPDCYSKRYCPDHLPKRTS